MKLPSLRWRVAAGAILLLALGAWLWKATRPRVMTVCIFPDVTFRKQPNWREKLESRVAAVSRLWDREVGIQWRISKIESDDPTEYLMGYQTRRIELRNDTHCASDVLLIVTGVREDKLSGSVAAFSHSALVVDLAGQSEEANVQNLSHQLTLLFGAPEVSQATATAADRFPDRTRKLIRRLRNYPFASDVFGLDDDWDRRAVKAIEAANAGVSPHPPARAHLVLALSLLADGRAGAAVAHLREAARSDPQSQAIRQALASALANDLQSDEAIAVLRDAIRDFPSSGALHGQLGMLLASRDRVAAAAELRAGILLEPRNPQLYAGMGGVFLGGNGHLDDAVAMFQAALRLDSQLADAQKGLVAALQLKEKRRVELDQQRHKAAQEPANAQAQFDLGGAELQLGHFEEASGAYRRAIALYPSFGQAHANLAMVRFLLKDFDGARLEVEKARALGVKPDNYLLNGLQENTRQ